MILAAAQTAGVSITAILGFLGALIAVVAAITSAWAVAKSSAAQATIGLQEKQIAALSARLTLVEEERDDLRTEVQALKTANAALASIVGAIQKGGSA